MSDEGGHRMEDRLDLAGSLETVRPFLVHVQAVTETTGAFGAGTGLIFDDSHLVASAQVVSAGDRVSIRTSDGRKQSCRVVGVDSVYAVALLEAEEPLAEGLPPLKVAPLPRPGEPVLTAGCPFGLDVVVSAGVVSATDLTVYRNDHVPIDGLLGVDASLHAGNLGGAVIRPGGGIAGVSLMPWVPGFFLAARVDVISRVVAQVLEYGRATHPWLGFSGQPEVVDAALRDLFDLPVERGLVVNHVAPSGPGMRAGVQVFDVVVRVDGKVPSSVGDVRQRLSQLRPGQEITMTILRGGDLMDVSFPVEDIPRLHGNAPNN